MNSAVTLMVMVVTGISGDTFSRMIPVEYPWDYRYADVYELSNGSLATVNGMVMEDLQVFIFDSMGNLSSVMDDLSVPGRALESGGWLIPLADGGFYMVSFSEPRATGIDSDIAVFKVSEDLEVEWTEIVGEDTEEVFTCFGATGTGDGGVVILAGQGYAGQDAFLRAYNSRGEQLWEHGYSEDDGFLPLGVGHVDDGYLVLLSHQWRENTFLQKFDSRGNMEWELAVPFTSESGPVSFCSVDAGYAVYYPGGEDRTRSGVTVIANPAGERIGTGVFAHGMVLQDVLIEDSYQVTLVGSRVIDGVNSAVMEAYDMVGNLTWKRKLQGLGEDGFTGICSCAGGGYLLTGYCLSEDEGVESGSILVRTDEQGCVDGGANPTQIPMPR